MPFALGDAAPCFEAGYNASDYEVQVVGVFPFITGSSITGNIDIGSADPTREIFAVLGLIGASGTIPIDVTVNGNNMTQETAYNSNMPGGAVGYVSAYRLQLASGANSVPIAVNFFGFPVMVIVQAVICFFRLVKRPGAGGAANDTQGANANATSVSLNSVTIPANGFSLNCCVQYNPTITGPPDAIQVYNADGGGGTGAIQVCYYPIQKSSITPTTTWSGGSMNRQAGGWSFG